MVDPETIAIYDTAAGEYASKFTKSGPDVQLTAFMDLLPAGGSVLDLGCGPATASAHMRAAGFDCDPVDASDGMIKIANDLHAIGARKLTFDDIDMVAAYDGVWANFSLLHAARADLPRHFAAIATALRDNGIFSVAMKTGSNAARDRLGRMYTYVTISELSDLLTNAGFSILGVDEGMGAGLAGDVSPWVTIRARKD